MSNRYEFDTAGNLVHFVHDEPRALVAPANIAAYRESNPDAPEAPRQAPAVKAASGRKGGK